MEIGSLAELTGGVASIVAAAMSIAALFVAIQANRHAKEANRTSNETLRVSAETRNDSLEAGKLEGRSRIASQLQAWWVATEDNEWAVIVVNGSSGATVFRDVKITVAYKGTSSVIPIEVLPPGKFLVRSKGPNQGWQPIPRPLTDPARWSPITRSRHHGISSITFRDPLGSRWVWGERGGLRTAAD